MDNEAAEMRQQMDETMAGLTDKLGNLEHQVSGTVRTVKDSVNTVRDTFDVKLQVRRRPWTAFAGATALGFLLGSRSNNCGAGRAPVRNGRSASTPRTRAAAAGRPCAEAANDGTNGAKASRGSAAPAPNWLANLGDTFHPEIAALRGIAAGALFELVREMIAKPVPEPNAGSAGNPANDSQRQAGRSRPPG